MSQDLTKISTKRLLNMFRAARTWILDVEEFYHLSEEEKQKKRNNYDALKNELDKREHIARKKDQK